MRLRFKLNHLYQGQNAPFLHAVDAGLFRQAGLEVEFVEGFSSSQVSRALLAGDAEIGFGDMTNVLEGAIRSGEAPIRALMPIYVRSPCSLGYHRRAVPLALEDIDGAVLCGPDGDTSARLLPLLLARNGLGDVRYGFRVVAPAERDRMVAAREVLAATCFDATLKFAMRMRGHDSSDIEFLYFADHGLDVYSSALLCLSSVLEARPDLATTLSRVVRTAWQACAADPDLGVRAVIARAPALDPGIVREQLEWVLANQVFCPTQAPFRFLRDDRRWHDTLHVAQFGATGSWELGPETAGLADSILRPAFH